MMSVFRWNWSVMNAENLIDWPILDWGMVEHSILSNRTPWRNKMLFSQEADHMGFAMLTVLITSPPAGFCIWRETGVLFCTSCLSDRWDRPWHRFRRFSAAAPARSPASFLLLHFPRLTSYGMQQCCLYDFCLPVSRSDVSAHSVRVIREEGTFW